MRHESDFWKTRHSAIHAAEKWTSINGQSHVFGYGPASYRLSALLTLDSSPSSVLQTLNQIMVKLDKSISVSRKDLRRRPDGPIKTLAPRGY